MRAVVLAQVAGRVQEVPVRENEAVREGAQLVHLDTTEFSLRVSQARANQQSAEVEFRQLTLFDDEIEDPAVLEERRRIARTRSNLDQTEIELRQAELELERTRVLAPFEGRIADTVQRHRLLRSWETPTFTHPGFRQSFGHLPGRGSRKRAA
jgi:membrane fusion protein (multidrug efflux system)